MMIRLMKAAEHTTSYNKRRACKGAALLLGYGGSATRARPLYARYLYGDSHPLAHKERT